MKEPTRYLVLTALFFGVLLSGLVLIRQQTGQQGALDDSFSMSNTQPKMAKLQRPYQVPIDEQKDTHFGRTAS